MGDLFPYLPSYHVDVAYAKVIFHQIHHLPQLQVAIRGGLNQAYPQIREAHEFLDIRVIKRGHQLFIIRFSSAEIQAVPIGFNIKEYLSETVAVFISTDHVVWIGGRDRFRRLAAVEVLVAVSTVHVVLQRLPRGAFVHGLLEYHLMGPHGTEIHLNFAQLIGFAPGEGDIGLDGRRIGSVIQPRPGVPACLLVSSQAVVTIVQLQTENRRSTDTFLYVVWREGVNLYVNSSRRTLIT